MSWAKDGYDMMSPVPLRAAPHPAPVPVPAPVPEAVPGEPELQYVSGFGGGIPLVPPRGFRSAKMIGTLFIIGGILGGFVVWGAFTIMEFIFSFMGGGGPSGFPLVSGIVVAVGGLGIGIYFWNRAERETCVVTVGSAHVSVALPEWRVPLVVPRDTVQFVTVDDSPMVPFTKNARFPIAGELPDAVFADALDRDGRNPWEPAKSQVPYQLPTEAPAPVKHDAAEHDDGWATVGSRPVPEARGRAGHLYSGDGSALPIFVYNEIDIPNLAIMFRRELDLPRRSHVFSMMQRRSLRSSNARKARGLLLRARNGVQAEAAFAPWGVVRSPHADEVLSAGLRPPKPLKGLRAVAFGAMMFAPIILKIIFREW